MADSEAEAQYKHEFMERVKAARTAAKMKQWQIADALGMPQDKYKQYEVRSLLPHHLMARFCIITRVDPEWLVTGRGEKPLKPLHVIGGDTKPAAKPKRKRTKRVA